MNCVNVHKQVNKYEVESAHIYKSSVTQDKYGIDVDSPELSDGERDLLLDVLMLTGLL